MIERPSGRVLISRCATPSGDDDDKVQLRNVFYRIRKKDFSKEKNKDGRGKRLERRHVSTSVKLASVTKGTSANLKFQVGFFVFFGPLSAADGCGRDDINLVPRVAKKTLRCMMI